MAVLLVAVCVVAAALAGPWRLTLREQTGPEPSVPVDAPTAMPTPTPDPLLEQLEALDVEPWDLRWLGTLIAVLLLGGLLYAVVAWLRRREPVRGSGGAPDAAGVEASGTVGTDAQVLPDLPSLRGGVQDADGHLRARLAPADAVIAAWVSLEEAAERAGLPREPSSTPTEFTVTVLDRTAVDPRATRALLDLYLRARFGAQVLTPDDVAAAAGAVRMLAAGLGGAEEPDDGAGARDRSGPQDDGGSPGTAGTGEPS